MMSPAKSDLIFLPAFTPKAEARMASIPGLF